MSGRSGVGGLRAGMPCIVWADICAALAPYCSILLWVNFLDAWIARNTSHISIHSPPPCLQRNDIVLDCCKIGLDEARFAQQAAALTGGIYLRVAEPAALLQYLLVRLEAWQRVRLARYQLFSVTISSPGRRWCLRRGRRRAPCCGRRRARGRRAARRACATGSPS